MWHIGSWHIAHSKLYELSGALGPSPIWSLGGGNALSPIGPPAISQAGAVEVPVPAIHARCLGWALRRLQRSGAPGFRKFRVPAKITGAGIPEILGSGGIPVPQ